MIRLALAAILSVCVVAICTHYAGSSASPWIGLCVCAVAVGVAVIDKRTTR